MKFDRHIGSTAAEVPVKFQSDRTILNTNLAASRLYEILRKDVFSDIETGPWGPYHIFFFYNSNLVKIMFCCISIFAHYIPTNLWTGHHSIGFAIWTCAKLCSGPFGTICMRLIAWLIGFNIAFDSERNSWDKSKFPSDSNCISMQNIICGISSCSAILRWIWHVARQSLLGVLTYCFVM